MRSVVWRSIWVRAQQSSNWISGLLTVAVILREGRTKVVIKASVISIVYISLPNIAAEVIQEGGEDLAELLGRVLESKILVNRVVQILEDLQ